MTATQPDGCTINCHAIGVRFSDKVVALHEVNLSLPAGKIVALIGPSGCGKTTLLRVMAGLQTPTSGNLSLDPPIAGKGGDVAFVFQQPALMPWRTAIENVLVPLQLIGDLPRRQQIDAAKSMLESVGLIDAMDQRPHELSGGMQMRVSIARALVTRPRLLLLDEPFAAIDDMLRDQLGQLLIELWQQYQMTTVIVTHNIAEAAFLSHQIAVIREGRVTAEVENPLPFPRTHELRRSAEFGAFYGEISDRLRGRES